MSEHGRPRPDIMAPVNRLTEPADLEAALDDVSALGPFFAATANPAEEVDPSWRPLRLLYTDPAGMLARYRQVASALDTDNERVVASIAHQGLVARVVSPLIGVASVHRIVPNWSPDSVHWRFAATGSWPLWIAGDTPGPVDRAGLALAVLDQAVPHLVGLESVVRATASVSARTLRGNAASAVVAAGRLVAKSRPDAASAASEVVDALLGSDPLEGAGMLGTGWAFRRRSCCLYYRIAGGGLCGDCVLAGRNRRSATV